MGKINQAMRNFFDGEELSMQERRLLKGFYTANKYELEKDEATQSVQFA